MKLNIRVYLYTLWKLKNKFFLKKILIKIANENVGPPVTGEIRRICVRFSLELPLLPSNDNDFYDNWDQFLWCRKALLHSCSVRHEGWTEYGVCPTHYCMLRPNVCYVRPMKKLFQFNFQPFNQYFLNNWAKLKTQKCSCFLLAILSTCSCFRDFRCYNCSKWTVSIIRT